MLIVHARLRQITVVPDANHVGGFPPRHYGRSNEDVGDLDDVDDRRNGFLAAYHSIYDAAMWTIMKVCIFRSHMSVHTQSDSLG